GDYTFNGATTYYVTGEFNITGTATIEGGTVIKFAKDAGAMVYMDGPVNCLTSPYRPAIFTAQDDNSVGETISGSTGSPSGYYASSDLMVDFDAPALDLENLRFGYAYIGLNWSDENFSVLRNCQFVNVQTAIENYGATLSLENALLYQVSG